MINNKENNLSFRILDQQEKFLANRLDFDINNFNTLEDVSKICHFKDLKSRESNPNTENISNLKNYRLTISLKSGPVTVPKVLLVLFTV